MCLLQEPYLFNKGIKLFPRGIQVSQGVTDRGPRACILSSLDMGLSLVPQYSGRDITTCRWEDKLNHREVYFVSVYSDIELLSINPELMRLVDYANNKSIEVVIGIDSNAHSTMWGCETNNQRGDMFEDFIVSNMLTLQNIGSNWTFESTIGKSIIDITLTSFGVAGCIDSWWVNADWLNSDHK